MALTGAKDVIDAVLTQSHELDPTDTYYSEWTARCVTFLTMVVSEFWDYTSAWEFKISDPATVTIAPGVLFGLLPVDFGRIGPNGLVSIPSRPNDPLVWRPSKQFQKEGRQGLILTGPFPSIYTISGRDLATRKSKIQIAPYPAASDAAVALQVVYELRRPLITYANPGGLEYVPDEYWETVMYWGLVDALGVNGGDGRALSELSPRFAALLREAASGRVQGIEQTQQYGDEGIPEEGQW